MPCSSSPTNWHASPSSTTPKRMALQPIEMSLDWNPAVNGPRRGKTVARNADRARPQEPSAEVHMNGEGHDFEYDGEDLEASDEMSEMDEADGSEDLEASDESFESDEGFESDEASDES